MYTYEFNDYKYRTPNKLNDDQIRHKVSELKESGAFDPEAREQEDLGYQDLLANKSLIDHVARFQTRRTGENWGKKTNEEVIDSYYQVMRDINHNTVSAGKLAAEMMGDKFDEDDRFAVREMFETWDNVVPFYKDKGRKWEGFLDLAESYGTDPFVLGGVVTGGMATLGGQAAKQAALLGVKHAIKRYAVKGAKFGAIEGTAVGATHNFGNQLLKTEVGMQDEISGADVVKSALFGGTVGAAFGGLVGGGTGAYRAVKMKKLQEKGVDVGTVGDTISSTQVQAANTVKRVKGGGSEVTAPDGQVSKISKGEDGKWQIGSPDGSIKTGFRTQKEAVAYLENVSKEKAKKAAQKKGDLTEEELLAAETAKKKLQSGQRLEAADELAIKLADDQVKRDARREAYDAFVARVDTAMQSELKKRGVGKEGTRTAKQDAADAQGILKNFGFDRDTFDLDEALDIFSYHLAPQVRKVADDGSISYIDKPKPVTNKKTGKKKYKTEQLVNMGIELEQMALDRARKSWADESPDFMQHYDSFEKMMLARMEVGSEAGRTLNYMKNVSKMRTHHLMDMMDAVGQSSHRADDIMKALEQVANTKLKPSQKVMDVINEYFVHNILTAGSTMAVNTISSAMNMHMRSMDNMVGGALTANSQQIRRGAVEFATIYTNLWASTKAALDTMIVGQAQINPRKMFAESIEKGNIAIGNRDYNMKRLFSKDFKNEFKEANESIAMAAANVIGNTNRFVGKRIMLTSDEFVKQMAFRSTLTADLVEDKMRKGMKWNQAWKEANEEAATLSENHVKRMAEGQAPENKFTQRARDEADASTFQDDFKQDIFGAVGRGSNELRQKIPVLTVLMPFIRTPANLLSYAGQRTPLLNAFSKEIRDQISAGGEQAARAEAALVTGTMFWAAAAMYATSGQLTGPDPLDRGRKNVTQAADVLPYSFVSEDGTHTKINRYDPVARPFLTMGAIHDVFKYETNDAQTALFADLVLATARSSLAMPSLQGVSRVMDLATEREGKTAGQKMSAFLGSTGRSFMPYYRMIDEINSFSDDLHQIPEVKSLDDAWHGYKSSVTKLTTGNYANSNVKRDQIFGFPIERDAMWFGMSGLSYRPRRDDAVYNEVMDEMQRLGLRQGSLAPKHALLGSKNLREYMVNDETNRNLYDLYQERVGTVKDTQGYTLMQALHELINSEVYLSSYMSDPVRTAGLPTNEGTRVKKIKEAIGKFRTLAAQDLQKQIKQQPEHPLNEFIDLFTDQNNREGNEVGILGGPQ